MGDCVVSRSPVNNSSHFCALFWCFLLRVKFLGPKMCCGWLLAYSLFLILETVSQCHDESIISWFTARALGRSSGARPVSFLERRCNCNLLLSSHGKKIFLWSPGVNTHVRRLFCHFVMCLTEKGVVSMSAFKWFLVCLRNLPAAVQRLFYSWCGKTVVSGLQTRRFLACSVGQESASFKFCCSYLVTC